MREDTLASVCQACKAMAQHVVAAAGTARVFPDECTRIAKFAKRLHPLLDDIEQGVPRIQPHAAQAGVGQMQVMLAALQRCHAAVVRTASLGPFYARMHDAELVSEYANCCSDVASALSKLPLVQLSAEEFTDEVALMLQQLGRVGVDYGASTQRAAVMTELRAASEALRCGRPGSAPLPALEMTQSVLRDCTYQQLDADVEFLRSRLEVAERHRNWVDVFFLKQLVALEESLLPKQGKQGRATGGSGGAPRVTPLPEHRVAALAAPAAAAGGDDDDDLGLGFADPIVEIRTLLEKVTNPKFSLEQRLATLQPLAAAAGLAPPVAGSALHPGSVLFALTDPDCAQKVVGIVNSDTLQPEIKLWMLSLMLSLVHPETGLNPDTQAALMATGLPRALCRLLVRSTTPSEQRIQALAMLRVMVNDAETHALLVEAKVVPAIVKVVWEVKLLNGRMVVVRPPATASSGLAAGASPPVVWGVEQQMRQLAAAMLADLGAAQTYRGEILSSGAVVALAARLSDLGSHAQVRVACADALAVLCEDGAIALEAARSDALTGLVEMVASAGASGNGGSGGDELAAAGAHAIRSLLTPSQPMSAATAAAAMRETGSSGGTCARVTSAADDADDGEVPLVDQGAMMAAMGKAFTPAATAALMRLLGNADVAPLALTLLPLSATDERCRAAIAGDGQGMEALLAMAASGHADAADTLVRLAADPKLANQVAGRLGRGIVASQGNPAQAAALARAIAAIGTPSQGLAGDSKAAARAARFADEVIEVGGLPMLVQLARSAPDPAARRAAVEALAPMCRYGEPPTQAALLEADVPMVLADAANAGDDALLVAAAGALAGLAAGASPDVRARIFGMLLGPLNSQDAAGRTCHVIRTVAGLNSEAYLEVERVGGPQLLPRMVQLVAPGQAPAQVLQPALLLASLCRWSPTAGAAAIAAGAVPALLQLTSCSGATGHGGGGAKTGGGGDMAEEWGVRTAAAATIGFLCRHDDSARNQVTKAGGLAHMLEVARGAPPSTSWWEEAMAGISLLCALHEPCRREAADALYLMLKRGTPPPPSAGAIRSAAVASAAAAQRGVAAAAVGEAGAAAATGGSAGGDAAAAASVVCSHMARSPRGREVLLGDGFVEQLAKVLAGGGSARAKAAAADALGHLATVSSVAVPNSEGKPVAVDPRAVIANAGCMEHLVAMLSMPEEECVFEAAETLEILAPCDVASRAAAAAGATAALNAVVQAGKKGRVAQRTANVAYAAYSLYVGTGGRSGRRPVR